MPESTALPSEPRSRSWNLEETARLYRAHLVSERNRIVVRRALPYLLFVAFLGILARSEPGRSVVLLYWILGLVAFAAVLGISLAVLLRLAQAATHRPLATRLDLDAQRLRLWPADGPERAIEAPLVPGRVFVSPPGANPPSPVDGTFSPRAFVRVEPEGAAAFTSPVPDDAARAVHRAMSTAGSFGFGYDTDRDPPTRVWVVYRAEGPPGTATGVLAGLSPDEVWSPSPTNYVQLSHQGKLVNPDRR